MLVASEERRDGFTGLLSEAGVLAYECCGDVGNDGARYSTQKLSGAPECGLVVLVINLFRGLLQELHQEICGRVFVWP